MRIVAALGGNALLPRGAPAEAAVQRAHVRGAVAALVPLAEGHELIVTHGNGPQVGLLALQSEAYGEVSPYPLDVLTAESAGMIGYMLDLEFSSQLPGRRVATLLTQVEVDRADPAFLRPSKPIGPVYDGTTARRLGDTRGWTVGPDGAGFRRLVASPEPRRIVEAETICVLVDLGVVVVCVGGGGMPVVVEEGAWRGVEAVVDKDLSAALLAERVGADLLLLLTDVDGVYLEWGTAEARLVRAASPAAIRELQLAHGSMGPKAEAAARFAQSGASAVIASLADASAAACGDAGTLVSSTVAGLVRDLG